MAAAAARADGQAHSSASSRRPPRPPRAPTARAASLRAPGPSSRAWESQPTRLSVRGTDTLGADQRVGGGGSRRAIPALLPAGVFRRGRDSASCLSSAVAPDPPARPAQPGARLPGGRGDSWGLGTLVYRKNPRDRRARLSAPSALGDFGQVSTALSVSMKRFRHRCSEAH